MPSCFGVCVLRILGALYHLIFTSYGVSLRTLCLYSRSCLLSMASAESSRMIFKLSGLPFKQAKGDIVSRSVCQVSCPDWFLCTECCSQSRTMMSSALLIYLMLGLSLFRSHRLHDENLSLLAKHIRAYAKSFFLYEYPCFPLCVTAG